MPTPERQPHFLEDDPRFQWLRKALRDCQNCHLVTDPRLTRAVAVDRQTRTIILPDGHTFDDAYHWATRGLLYVVGGIEWATEFTGPGRHLRVVDGR